MSFGLAYGLGLLAWLAVAVFVVVVPELRRAPKLPPRRRVRVKFERRDMWIGVYRDTERRRLYVCVVPCLPIVIERAAAVEGERKQ